MWSKLKNNNNIKFEGVTQNSTVNQKQKQKPDRYYTQIMSRVNQCYECKTNIYWDEKNERNTRLNCVHYTFKFYCELHGKEWFMLMINTTSKIKPYLCPRLPSCIFIVSLLEKIISFHLEIWNKLDKKIYFWTWFSNHLCAESKLGYYCA